MRQWYVRRDVLPGGRETLVGETSTLDETVRLILRDTRLLSGQPVESS
ncbi:hypothetical protein [Nonomuraea sp. SYSU D8015]|nr:hypothetical protein [Nonomuraea sp. SYSU D8015]